MAKATHVWLQSAIALCYLVAGFIFNFYTASSPRENWQPYTLLAVVWLLSSAYVLFRAVNSGIAAELSKRDLLTNVSAQSAILLWNVNDRGVLIGIDGHLEEKEGLGAADFLGNKVDVFKSVNPDFHELLKKAKKGEYFEDCCYIGNRYYRHHFSPVSAGSDGQNGFQCISLDISVENQLRDKVELSQQIFSKTTEAIVILDRQRMVSSVNHAFTELTGIAPNQMVGTRGGFGMIGQPSVGFYRRVLHGLKQSGYWTDEISLRRASGELFTAKFMVALIKDEYGLVCNYVIFFSDLTHIERTHEELRYLADHDNLTDLPNRRLFLDRLDQGVKRAQRSKSQLAVFFIDLDNFKLINDAHGHQAGDEILKEVGRRLLSAVRLSDTVARLAGDEFTIITENVTDSMEVTSIARKIMSCFESPFRVFEEMIEMSASVGIGVYPDDGEDLTNLLKRADEAMYKAKSEGRNGFYSLSEGRSGHLPEAMFFPSELRLALKRGQMELVYQPLQDLRTGRVMGCEGLLRWNHHCRGIIPPTDFMTLSEGAGITSAIGKWTLDEACNQLQAWRREQVDLEYVSINIASSQINDPGYGEMVIDALAKFQLHSSSLMLEVSEGVLLRNLTQACQLMRHLGDIGVRFCVDEFGSSSADYSYIREIPADTLKIDQRLLARTRTGKEDTNLIRALIGIGDILGKNVVAVGVERPGQEELIRELGCNLAQGYLYAKPMSAESFSKAYTRPVATGSLLRG